MTTTNTINLAARGMPLAYNAFPTQPQGGLQLNAKISTVPIFSPDDGALGGANGMGRFGPMNAMAGIAGMNDAGAARGRHVDAGLGAQALGNGGGGGSAGGNGAQIMGGLTNIFQSVMSAVSQLLPPVMGMIGSLVGGMGATGGQGTGAA